MKIEFREDINDVEILMEDIFKIIGQYLKYCFIGEINDVENRQAVTRLVEEVLFVMKFRFNLFERYVVRCNQFNNTPEIIDDCKLHIFVMFKDKNGKLWGGVIEIYNLDYNIKFYF